MIDILKKKNKVEESILFYYHFQTFRTDEKIKYKKLVI